MPTPVERVANLCCGHATCQREVADLVADTRTTVVAEAVMAHAEAHYDDGGWDVVVECMTVDEIVAQWRDSDAPVPTTVAEGVERMSGPVSVWADRQADARNSAF